MKVVALQGSPHRAGNTARLLSLIEEELKAQGHELETFQLDTLDVKPCRSCGLCAEVAEFRCVRIDGDDDANDIFAAMAAADGLIFATPLYFWSFSAQLKTLIDRSISQVKDFGGARHRSAFQNKPAALLVTCVGPREDNADLIPQIFQRWLNYSLCKNAGALIVPGCVDGDEFSEDVREQAVFLAGGLEALGA